MNAGVIGCGAMGTIHAQTAVDCGLGVVACGDPSDARAAALAVVHGARYYDDPFQVIHDAEVEVIIVSSPTSSHSDYVLAACEAGKHVFCETPLSRTAEEARNILKTAEQSSAKLFVGHVTRYSHALVALEEQVDSGKIGSVRFAKTYRAGVCPRGYDNWYRDFERSGGVAFDGLIHDFDWICQTFGPAKSVFCRNLLRETPEPLDYAMATLTLESGMIAQLVGSWAHAADHRVAVELVGDEGIARYDSADAPIVVAHRSADDELPEIPIPSSPMAKSTYKLEWEDFLSWVDRDTVPQVTPQMAAEAVRIAEAALESAQTGGPVNV